MAGRARYHGRKAAEPQNMTGQEMTEPIDELQRAIADPKVSVVSLLQRAIPLAKKLSDEEFVKWATKELSGYSKEGSAAHHRCLKGQYVVLAVDGHPIQIHWGDTNLPMNSRFITLPLAEIESLLSGDSDTFAVKINVDPGKLPALDLEPGDTIGFSVSRATTIGFLNALRNQILEWTLTFDQPGETSTVKFEAGPLLGSDLKAPAVAPITQEEAIRRLSEQIDSLAQITDHEFHGWRHRTLGILERIFGEESRQVHTFRGTKVTSSLSALSRAARDPTADRRNILTTAPISSVLSAFIAEIRDFGVSPNATSHQELASILTSAKDTTMATDKRKVFVVHGRNDAARRALFEFLRSINLHPLEWSEIVQETGKASPFVGEVLDKAFSIAQAVVVLMTPDDEARLRTSFCRTGDPAYESVLTPQPRPNVLYEAGMSLGLFPDRTVIVELGTLRPMSDLFGRHVVRMNNIPSTRQDLAQRLQTAGCSVSLAGRDWHSAGDFETCIPSGNVGGDAGCDALVFLKGAYCEKDFEGNATGSPYCPTCYEHDGKRLHLTHPGPPFPYECRKCGARIQCEDSEPIGSTIASGPLLSPDRQ